MPLSKKSCSFSLLLLGLAVASLVDAEAPAKIEPLEIADAVASTPSEMKPYTERIEHTEVEFEMLPIAGGEFRMGSPEGEMDRGDDEGPQRNVKVSPFWMGKCEVTWDEYDVWNEEVDQRMRKMLALQATPRDLAVDGFSKPTEPYTDMSFGMGRDDYPAICMTQHAARTYCKWLSAKTGRYYRLPTEAEWEYACRAGTTSAYSFGDDPDQLEDYAWFFDNSEDSYQRVGQKKPNPWGLHDMHGNVSEWVLDQYAPYDSIKESVNPLVIPKTLYPRVVRGGGWDDDPEVLRSAARKASAEEWKEQDPQEPKSIWYHTDALSVGFRIVRPFEVPSDEQRTEKWDNTAPEQKDPED
jgi:formylglycine-generating enzyme required for sulfatase activity